MKLLKGILKRAGQRSKKTSRKPRGKKWGGFRSREEWHGDLERRFGKPGRVPEDVA